MADPWARSKNLGSIVSFWRCDNDGPGELWAPVLNEALIYGP